MMLQAKRFTQLAVICFVRDGNRLLLIEKLRGLGMGKVNGPGGKCEPGETGIEAAIRETQEEVLITPLVPELMGSLGFRFQDGYSLLVEVYLSTSWTGTIGNTEEAIPFWCDIASIPYQRMWADDRLWLPHVLNGKKIRGYFDFDSDSILRAQISVSPSRRAQ